MELAKIAVKCSSAAVIVSWMSGGYLGVSVFFTLSGYLITSLLLAEHAATGTIDLRAFFVRRIRRLLPAAYLCVALVLAHGALWAGGQRRNLPGDVFAAYRAAVA